MTLMRVIARTTLLVTGTVITVDRSLASTPMGPSAEASPATVLEAAFSDAPLVEDPFRRSVAYAYVAEAQARDGMFEAAKRTLHVALESEDRILRMASGDHKDDRLFTIGEAWARLGDARMAASIVEDKAQPRNRANGLERIAATLAKRGDIHAATFIASRMSSEDRAKILALIKDVRPDSDDAPAEDDSPACRCLALIEAAKKTAMQGNRDEARELVRQAAELAEKLSDPEGQSGTREAVLAFVAGGWAAIGDVTQATEGAANQKDPWTRAMARVRIAHALTHGSPYRGKILLIGATAATNREVSPAVVMAIRPDGSGLETLYRFEGALVGRGCLSRDGRWLALTVTEVNRTTAIWLIGPDGRRRQLPNKGFIQSWSPDGKELAIYRGAATGWQSLLVDVASGTERMLPLPAQDVLEGWTHDGKRLTVMAGNPEKFLETPRGRYPKRSLYSTKLDAFDRLELTVEPEFDQMDARYSPDGSKIAHFRRENPDVHRVRHYGIVRDTNRSGALSSVAFDPLVDQWNKGYVGKPQGAPSWSPDGKTVVWVIWRYPRSSSSGLVFYDLAFTSVTGAFERRIELYTLGIVSVGTVEWR